MGHGRGTDGGACVDAFRRRRPQRGIRVKKRRRAASDKQYGTGFAPQRVQNLFRMETTTETRNSSQRVSIGLLNDAVGKEIASSLQYIYFHVHFEDARYRFLSELMHRVAIAEMRHIELFAERILFLGGRRRDEPFVPHPAAGRAA